VKILHQQGIIVDAQVNDTKTSFFLGEADHRPGSFGGLFGIKIRSPPKAMFSILVQLINDPFMKLKSATVIDYRGGEDRIDHFKPASLG
jgi:hypothetical protein